MREVGFFIHFVSHPPPPYKGKGWDEGHDVIGRIVFERGGGKYYSSNIR